MTKAHFAALVAVGVLAAGAADATGGGQDKSVAEANAAGDRAAAHTAARRGPRGPRGRRGPRGYPGVAGLSYTDEYTTTMCAAGPTFQDCQVQGARAPCPRGTLTVSGRFYVEGEIGAAGVYPDENMYAAIATNYGPGEAELTVQAICALVSGRPRARPASGTFAQDLASVRSRGGSVVR